MTQENIDIFLYNDPIDFLLAIYAEKKKRNTRFSIRAWSKQLNFSHHSSLDHILQRRRPIPLNKINSFTKKLNLSLNEKEYFLKLIQLKKSISTLEKEQLDSELKQMKSSRQYTHIQKDAFKVVADWHHFAICAMTMLKDFKNDPEWISKRLDHKISPKQVTTAIERLKNIGMLEEKNNTLFMPQTNLTCWTDGIDVEKLILHHQSQLLKLASHLVLTPEIKNIAESSFMTIDKNKLPEAQKMIREFRSNLAQLMEKPNGDETYALSIQFFPITSKVSTLVDT